jgi:hypothetical protein
MRRREGDEESFVAITFFDSFDSIRVFAGDDLERAVIDPEARRLLSRIEDRCAHYTIVVEDAPGG